MKNSVLAALAGLAAMSGAAQAQSTVLSNPRGMVENFDISNLGPVLTELGIVWQSAQTANGAPFIKASIGQNQSFWIMPAACANKAAHTGCVGANFVIAYEGLNPNPQTVAAYNQAIPFVSAGMFTSSTTAFLSRYEIADFGIPRGNVESSLGNFMYAAEDFRKQISGANTVSLDGYADDMLASGLNARAAGAVSLASMEAQSVNAAHRETIAMAPLLIKQMIENDEAPVNKITNITSK